MLRRELLNQKLDRTVRRTPGNEVVSLRDRVGPQVQKVLSRFGLIPASVARRRARHFEEDLRLLNDVLAATDLRRRYWVWGGMLLGWAREGRLLGHDIGDADFAYSAEDEHLMDAAEAVLLAAGFRRWFSFWSNSGMRTETGTRRTQTGATSTTEQWSSDDAGDPSAKAECPSGRPRNPTGAGIGCITVHRFLICRDDPRPGHPASDGPSTAAATAVKVDPACS